MPDQDLDASSQPKMTPGFQDGANKRDNQNIEFIDFLEQSDSASKEDPNRIKDDEDIVKKLQENQNNNTLEGGKTDED